MKTAILVAFAVATLNAALPAAAAPGVPLAQASAPAAQKQRVVIQVSDPDPRLWAQAINYTENLQALLGKDNVEVEIVALGLGIGVLKLDSPHANRVGEALGRGVSIKACGSTMKRQKLTREDMLPGIEYVPGGLIRILERQQQGWSYIKG